MRNEEEIYRLIKSVTEQDTHVRAVYLNGSRANNNSQADLFQDYDVVFVVDNVLPYIENQQWIDIFGDRLMLREPDKLNKYLKKNTEFENTYTYLMLFTDGNRIDLKLQSKEYTVKNFLKEKRVLVLLDKDDLLSTTEMEPTYSYGIKKPTEG